MQKLFEIIEIITSINIVDDTEQHTSNTLFPHVPENFPFNFRQVVHLTHLALEF